MTGLLSRAARPFDPGRGLLAAEHFQIAYATTDMERAMALFRDRLGIAEFRSLEGPLPEGGHIRTELAWVGTVMYELVEATGPGSALFADGLPADRGFHMRHHHLGFLVHDRAQWTGMAAAAARNGWPLLRPGSNALVDVCFVHVPTLGHHLEYLLPTEAGLAFFEAVPRN